MDKQRILDAIRTITNGLQHDYTAEKSAFDHNTQAMIDSGISQVIDDTCIALLRLIEVA
jgi:predicted RNA binding protein with dsRBD fold (UPF0201 family)